MKTLRVQALEIQQGPGRTLYSFAVDGKRVPEFAEVSRIRRGAGGLEGYQRPEALAHVRAIADYLESERPMVPNAVVIAFDSRTRFEPVGKAMGGVRVGLLVIPVEEEYDTPRSGLIVDGQQRCAAVREAAVESFPLVVSAFITDSVEEQRAQFILVNNTKPLPKGLIRELLPGAEGRLPEALERTRLPAALVERLNLDEASPLRGLVKTATNPDGLIQDTSLINALENSIRDGALHALSRAGDVDEMVRVVGAWWEAVRLTWPKAWGLKPKQSRLFHGAGVMALSLVMDGASDVLTGRGEWLTAETFFRELARVAPACRWMEGHWEFPSGAVKWNELQNTSQSKRRLADYLAGLYHHRATK